MSMKCLECGAPIENDMCQYCGNVNGSEDIINDQMMNQFEDEISQKSKIITMLLCIFCGYLGLHRFYAGKIGTGILYLCTAGLFGIGWMVDILFIAVGLFKDGYGLRIK